MIKLKEGVDIIRVEQFFVNTTDTYFWVFISDNGFIRIESGLKSWLVNSLDEFLEAINCIDCEITQYKLVKL